MSAGSRVMSVLKNACGSRFPSGSRTKSQRTGKAGVPGLYHNAMSDVISSILPLTWPYQAETRMLVQRVAELASMVLSLGSAGPFCAGRPIVRDVRLAGGANRLASNRNRLMSVARGVMAWANSWTAKLLSPMKTIWQPARQLQRALTCPVRQQFGRQPR